MGIVRSKGIEKNTRIERNMGIERNTVIEKNMEIGSDTTRMKSSTERSKKNDCWSKGWNCLNKGKVKKMKSSWKDRVSSARNSQYGDVRRSGVRSGHYGGSSPSLTRLSTTLSHAWYKYTWHNACSTTLKHTGQDIAIHSPYVSSCQTYATYLHFLCIDWKNSQILFIA